MRITSYAAYFMLGLPWTLPSVLAGDFSPPASLRLHQLESAVKVYAFLESQVTLQAPLRVDISRPGRVSRKRELSRGYVPAGITVSSWIVHADPPGNREIRINSRRCFRDSTILGLIVTKKGLRNSDSLLGLPGTEYPQRVPHALRGLEFNGSDIIELSESRRCVSMSLRLNIGLDQFRVIVWTPKYPESESKASRSPYHTSRELLRPYRRRLR
jgi:hypothetical protein